MTVSGDKKTGNTAKQDLYDDLDKEWRRMLRDRMRKEKEKEKRRERLAEEEMSLLPNVKYSTAETRPNAYISTADLLPLPKPCGAQAPFKPSKPAYPQAKNQTNNDVENNTHIFIKLGVLIWRQVRRHLGFFEATMP